MYKHEISSIIFDSKIVAILRKIDNNKLLKVIESLVEGGVKCLEITADSENVFESIRSLKKHFGDEIVLGAGTILEPTSCRMAIDAGAQFIITPSLNIDVIKMSNKYGIPCFPGAMTPTEILTAYENGAEAVKVFPASTLGPSYFREISGPLGHVPVMATGGIGIDNIDEFIKKGVKYFGVGSSLTNKEAIKNEDYKMLTSIAKKFNEKVGNR